MTWYQKLKEEYKEPYGRHVHYVAFISLYVYVFHACICSVTVSISTIMNDSAPFQLDSPIMMAIYVSSLIMHDREYFAQHDFFIKSIGIRMWQLDTL